MITILVDPSGLFEKNGQSLSDTIAWCGLIPQWITAYDPEVLGTLRDHVEECYSFPCSYDGAGTIDENHVYHYPEDPPLYPLAVYICAATGQKCIQYQYGLVSFIEKQPDGSFKQHHTRMD